MAGRPQAGQGRWRRTARLALGAFFIGAGFLHFRAPGTYVRVMPTYLPHPLELVYLSGAAEIAGGVGVLLPSARRVAGLGLILLLIAVFPANVNMALHDLPFGSYRPPRAVQWLRLPLQLVLIAWVWWSTGPAPAGLGPSSNGERRR